MSSQPLVYVVSYTLKNTFIGASNVVTNVPLGASVATVTPGPLSRTAYVALNGTPPTSSVKAVGAVQMNIIISDGTSNVFYPLGLAVQNPSVRSRPNPAVFPLASVVASAPSVIILDDTASLDPSGTSYEFVILFQDSNGYFGTLDPMITNDQT